MKEAFELIRKKIAEKKEPIRPLVDYVFGSIGMAKAEEKNRLIDEMLSIVSEVEAEYGNGKTNADRIRSMTDEELAEITLQHDDEYGYIYCSDGTRYQDYGKGYEEALKHEIEWLKSNTTD